MTTITKAPRLTPEQVIAWRAAAVADGWTMRGSYGPESIDTSAHLSRPGYKALVRSSPASALPNGRPIPAYYALDLWSSDDIAITVPPVYSMDAIRENERTCPQCGATDVDTVRVHFASRSCMACAPALRKELETPGWCD